MECGENEHPQNVWGSQAQPQPCSGVARPATYAFKRNRFRSLCIRSLAAGLEPPMDLKPQGKGSRAIKWQSQQEQGFCFLKKSWGAYLLLSNSATIHWWGDYGSINLKERKTLWVILSHLFKLTEISALFKQSVKNVMRSKEEATHGLNQQWGNILIFV